MAFSNMRQHLHTGLLRALLALLVASAATPVSAEASQYCRLGLDQGQVDFCMAVGLYHNHSSAAQDLYLKLNVRRSAASEDAARLGWTAVGTGSRMQGSLMFIVYGDPNVGPGSEPAQPPTLSVRTSEKKHSRPVSIHAGDQHTSVDARVLDARWLPSGGGKSWTAELSVVCYACSKWDGEAIDAESVSQPWLWAWNEAQDMIPYGDEMDLPRHSIQNGGFGSFYVDMKSAETHHADDAMPTIKGETNVNASDMPIEEKEKPGLLGRIMERPLANLHGLLMSTAFLFLFPAGAVAIRSGSTKAFKHHWSIQVSAIIFALTGAATAIYMTGGDLFGSPHQIAGSTIAVLLLLQAVLGWRHHVNFVRIRSRTTISYGHITLGFAILVGGWANVLSGMILFGFGRLGVYLVGGLVVAEAVCVAGWAVLARRRQRVAAEASARETNASATYFALDDMESDEDEDIREGGKEEQKGLMKRA